MNHPKIMIEKVNEIEYFYRKIVKYNNLFSVFKFRIYLSCFINSCRNFTFCIQKYIGEDEKLKCWYENVRSNLKSDPHANYFLEMRNEITKTGYHPIQNGGIIYLDDSGNARHSFKFDQNYSEKKVQIPEGDVQEICLQHLKKILNIMKDFYINFGAENDVFFEEQYLSVADYLAQKDEFGINHDEIYIKYLGVNRYGIKSKNAC